MRVPDGGTGRRQSIMTGESVGLSEAGYARPRLIFESTGAGEGLIFWAEFDRVWKK